MKVVWSPAALSEVDEIFDYLHAFNPRAAVAVSTALIGSGNSLSEFPYRGRPVPETELRETVSVFPYVIRYRVIGDSVEIVRVRHTSRRPTDP